MKIIKEIIIYALVIIAALLIRTYIMTPIIVNGESMENTLHNNDLMILDKLSYHLGEIKRFDIIVIEREDDYIIKRVIGLPGETVEYRDNQLYINEQSIKEDFMHERTYDFKLSDIDVETIPEDMYFVMGDNRTNSTDSRYIGLIPKNKIWGKTSFIIFPFNRWGNVK